MISLLAGVYFIGHDQMTTLSRKQRNILISELGFKYTLSPTDVRGLVEFQAFYTRMADVQCKATQSCLAMMASKVFDIHEPSLDQIKNDPKFLLLLQRELTNEKCQ